MIHIGTWNVMTKVKPGKMQEIADQMLKTQLQIALQEIIWKGSCQRKEDKYSL
jgi:hypothetical protein